ncbi:MAG TPA: alpha/beta hydrolase-fold protein, partial [Isosphaeraceae bacterium]|nr:alpha/beta hydrolase-fold protein [Isosphaeraceae bacterium]
KSYVDMTLKALELGEQRAKLLAEGKTPWRDRPGGTAHGYVSEVDGSVQPYALYVPESYNGQTPMRLDVVLHGRNGTLTESSFIAAHEGKPYPDGETGLVLHVYGRGNNAYRWAGETDVFEAMKAVERNYRVDPRRVLLRGFSMGGAGAWHLGLHHPREWCSVEAGAGFSESKNYAKLKDLLDCQDKTLHIYDAEDYALNAFNVPIAGYGGEQDPQLQASENILKALLALGFEMNQDGLVTRAKSIDFIRVIGAKMGHKIDPASAEILKEFRDKHAEAAQDLRPDSVQFVTYTLAYNQAPWLQVEGLKQHYDRTLVEAHIDDDNDTLVVTKWDNVAFLSINRDVAATVRFGDDAFPLRPAVGGLLPNVTFQKVENGWHQLDYDESRALQLNAKRQKRPGLQGPIDHAFTGPFLCVRGTGRAWNPNVQSWADARLERFQKEWKTYMRGEVRVKDDDDLTQEDIDNHHLILFGDPGSNRKIAELAGILPLSWTR